MYDEGWLSPGEMYVVHYSDASPEIIEPVSFLPVVLDKQKHGYFCYAWLADMLLSLTPRDVERWIAADISPVLGSNPMESGPEFVARMSNTLVKPNRIFYAEPYDPHNLVHVVLEDEREAHSSAGLAAPHLSDAAKAG